MIWHRKCDTLSRGYDLTWKYISVRWSLCFLCKQHFKYSKIQKCEWSMTDFDTLTVLIISHKVDQSAVGWIPVSVNWVNYCCIRILSPMPYFTGLMTLVLTNPVWVVKTRLCLQYDTNASSIKSEKYYSGMFDALCKIYKHEGVRGWYKVLSVTWYYMGSLQYSLRVERSCQNWEAGLEFQLSRLFLSQVGIKILW